MINLQIPVIEYVILASYTYIFLLSVSKISLIIRISKSPTTWDICKSIAHASITPMFILWELWLTRNAHCFNNIESVPSAVIHKISKWLLELNSFIQPLKLLNFPV